MTIRPEVQAVVGAVAPELLAEVETAARNAESELGFEVPPMVMSYVLGYCVQKIRHYPPALDIELGYLPLLLPDELGSFFAGELINLCAMKGGEEPCVTSA